jgi:hypothetical protein
MKFYWLFTILVIGTSAITAAPLCTAFSGPQDVMSPGFACTLAGVTFKDFHVTGDAAGVPPQVDLVSAFGDVGARLDFRMSASQTGSDPLFLSYEVSLSGGVSVFQIPPLNNAVITVTACDSAFDALRCSGTQLARVVASPPDPLIHGPWPAAFIPLTSPLFVLTEIDANTGSVEGRPITFSESFAPGGTAIGAGSEVPEPISLVLAACWLMALIVARRFL